MSATPNQPALPAAQLAEYQRCVGNLEVELSYRSKHDPDGMLLVEVQSVKGAIEYVAYLEACVAAQVAQAQREAFQQGLERAARVVEQVHRQAIANYIRTLQPDSDLTAPKSAGINGGPNA